MGPGVKGLSLECGGKRSATPLWFRYLSTTDGCDRSQTTKALTGQRTPKFLSALQSFERTPK